MINLRGADVEAENAGVWVEYHDVQLRIASAGTLEYQAEMQKAIRAANGEYSELKAQHQIMAGVVARALLKDWRGVSDENGEVAYTPAIGEQTLLADYKTFKFIHDYALQEKHYKLKERQKIAGKSQRRSSGTSSGASKRHS